MSSEEKIERVRAIRAGLGHPVIDADGHYVEYAPALASFLADEGIGDVFVLYADASCGTGTLGVERLAPERRDQGQAVRGPWWAIPAESALDIATAMAPGLLYERMDAIGLDFAIMYGSAGLVFPHVRDEKHRRGACRALNRYAAEIFGPYADRLTPAAVVPLHSPEEGIEALEHAVLELGLKTVLIPSFVERPVPDEHRHPHRVWFDGYGIDSIHDYDPFWRRAAQLGVSLAAHSSTMGIGFRRSPTNYAFNHIGHFAASGEALAKSLVMGGVTRRFPALRLALLEGGVHWAVGLLGDLISHWEKRNIDAVRRYDPGRIDTARVASLLQQYGSMLTARGGVEVGVAAGAFAQAGPFDDFEAMQIRSAEELVDLFVPSLAFGCEADDPLSSLAFDRSRVPRGRPLRALFSSDIGHWDVPDMQEVLPEAYENVEKGWMSREDFRAFVFGNAARFYSEANPRFFAGTVVEEAVARELERAATPAVGGA
ncbi:MAG: amidohydrolase family protein [Myxococcota bacterium]